MRAYSLLFLGACLFMNSSLLARAGQAAQPAPEETSTAKGATGASPSLNGVYTIGPLDRLSINVWKEPELSRLVSVRPDGKISLPLVGDIQAAGLSPTALAAVIEKEMKRFIANPTTAVIVAGMHRQENVPRSHSLKRLYWNQSPATLNTSIPRKEWDSERRSLGERQTR